MDVEAIKQEAVDNEHLRLLALFHYISGGLTILFSCFFTLYLAFMSFVLKHADKFESASGETAPVEPKQIFAVFVAIFGTFVALGLLYGIAQVVSARYIKKRHNRTFSIIVAIPNLLFMPYGTILAIMTLIVLDRKSVKRLYEAKSMELDI